MSSVVWLVGCKGMLGTEVGLHLKNMGLNFQATDREVDIADSSAVGRFSEKKRFDWIVNCAAYTAVDRAEDEPEAAFRINAEGPSNLASLAGRMGIKLLHISTDYVFDGAKDGEYFENDTPNPLGVYGRSKLEGELRLRERLERHFILRTAWLYGRHGGNFVATMLRLFGERERIKVVNDQRGTPTYSADLARTIVKIVQDDVSHFGTYHFTDEGCVTWYRFAVEIYEKARRYGLVSKDVEIVPIGTLEYPAKAKRPMNSLLSKEKIKQTLGVKIRSWEETLDEYLKSLT